MSREAEMKERVQKAFARADEDEHDPNMALIDRASATTFFTVVIFLNMLFIGIDTDIRSYGDNDVATHISGAIAIVFLAIFMVELGMRIYADGWPDYFFSKWNILDLILVTFNFLEVLSLYTDTSSSLSSFRALKVLKVTRSLRLIRIFRVLRFKRVLRAFRWLTLLALAIFYSCFALAWIGLLVLISSFIFAIITTEFLGLVNEDNDPFIEEHFGSVAASMFTAVNIGTLDGWADIARYVGGMYGSYWQLFFVCFAIPCKLFLLNVIVAVLVERIFALMADLQDAKAGTLPQDDVASWMRTPSSLASDPPDPADIDDSETENAFNLTDQAIQRDLLALGGTPAGRLQVEILNALFDHLSEKVVREGIMNREATPETMLPNIPKPEVQQLIQDGIASWNMVEPQELVDRLFTMHNEHIALHPDEPMTREGFVKVGIAVHIRLAEKAFMDISDQFVRVDQHVAHEFGHLNKHGRKINRRFLKLRYRIRKVYHFDDRPKTIVGNIKEEHMKRQEERTRRQQTREADKKAKKDSAMASEATGTTLTDGTGAPEGTATDGEDMVMAPTVGAT